MIIQDDIIKAEEGKVLFYLPENTVWGLAARLANYKGHQLTVDDFDEIDVGEAEGFAQIDGKTYDFRYKSYAYIKTFVIKLHYSNDDQIALMLNYEENPEKYTDKYLEMQRWREFATDTAKRITNDKQ